MGSDRMKAPRAAALVAALACASVYTYAHDCSAQTAASDEAKKTARALMDEGRTARDETKDFKAALDAFRKAHSIMRVPTTGLEVARTLVLLEKFVEAEEAAQDVINIAPTPKEPKAFGAARDEAKKLLEDLKNKIGFIAVDIKGLPDGKSAEVLIDDLAVAADKGPVKQNPGKHKVVVKGPSNRSFDVELEPGGKKDIAVDFTPPKKEKVEEPPPPPPPPPEENRFLRPLPIIGFSVAGVGLIAGTVTGMLTLSKASSVKDQCVGSKCPRTVHDDIDSAKSMGTISTISFAVAGVGAAVGVIGVLLPTSSAPSEGGASTSKPRVTPFVGAGSAGVAGTFLPPTVSPLRPLTRPNRRRRGACAILPGDLGGRPDVTSARTLVLTTTYFFGASGLGALGGGGLGGALAGLGAPGAAPVGPCAGGGLGVVERVVLAGCVAPGAPVAGLTAGVPAAGGIVLRAARFDDAIRVVSASLSTGASDSSHSSPSSPSADDGGGVPSSSDASSSSSLAASISIAPMLCWFDGGGIS